MHVLIGAVVAAVEMLAVLVFSIGGSSERPSAVGECRQLRRRPGRRDSSPASVD